MGAGELELQAVSRPSHEGMAHSRSGTYTRGAVVKLQHGALSPSNAQALKTGWLGSYDEDGALKVGACPRLEQTCWLCTQSMRAGTPPCPQGLGAGAAQALASAFILRHCTAIVLLAWRRACTGCKAPQASLSCITLPMLVILR